MTIEANFRNMFGRGGGRQTQSAPETKPQVAVKPKQEQEQDHVSATVTKSIPWKEEPIWRAYCLDVSTTKLDLDLAHLMIDNELTQLSLLGLEYLGGLGTLVPCTLKQTGYT